MPRVISLTSSSGKISILRFSPMAATMSPSTGTQQQASAGSSTFSTCLPLRVMATTSSSGTMKPWPEVAATSSLRPGWCTKISTNVVVLLQVDHQPHRLAVAAPARQLIGRQREDLAVGGEQQQLVGGLTP